MRVVIDTNVLIDAATDEHAYTHRIIDEVVQGKIEAFANRQTLSENRLLAGQLLQDPAYERKLEMFFSLVRKTHDGPAVNLVAEDPEDDKLLAAAAAAKADFLVTSDKHLLKLESYKETEIVTPAQFWNRYEDNAGSGWKTWLEQFVK